jgi:hypothetical protein
MFLAKHYHLVTKKKKDLVMEIILNVTITIFLFFFKGKENGSSLVRV